MALDNNMKRSKAARKFSSRKIAYILGAGFSYGSGHKAPIGAGRMSMPLQSTLLKELCTFHHKKMHKLDAAAKYIRKYFNPNTFRSKRKRGSAKHKDLYGLSIEEIFTFFDELVRIEHPEKDKISEMMTDLQEMTAEVIAHLSTKGNPGQNPLLRKFVKRLAQTDVLITFNWDTILDRALSKRVGRYGRVFWHPSWGYGRVVRKNFVYRERKPRKRIPRKYPKLLKLHGSINWVAVNQKKSSITQGTIAKGWKFRKGKSSEVVMMPPKMIKPEIWGGDLSGLQKKVGAKGNAAVPYFYPDIWQEAQKQLEGCRRIVFIGYSFPPADFAVGNMIRRAISGMKVTERQFPKIDIVDPNVAELVQRFKQSFNIEVPMENQYLSLRSYLDSLRPR